MLLTPQGMSDAWNELRNAALGRGTSPRVSAELAAKVGDAYERWRAWLTGSLSEDLLRRWQADPSRGPAGTVGWYREYEALHAAVSAELAARGQAAPALYRPPLQHAAHSAAAIAMHGLHLVVGAVLVSGMFSTALSMWSRKGERR